MTRKILIGLLAAMFATAAYAACRTFTIIGPDGRVMICTECCYAGGSCTITCV